MVVEVDSMEVATVSEGKLNRQIKLLIVKKISIYS